MKLQQLRYLVAVVKHNLNVTAAADALYTSQPGVSKQIRLLEDELGIQIFTRSGKQLTHVTPVGKQVVSMAEAMLRDAGNIKVLADEYQDHIRGSLAIATTHTQARYALPMVLQHFKQQFPEVNIAVHQGSPSQIAELVAAGKVDFAITTESPELFNDLVMLPCYRWNRSILVPQKHPLTQIEPITLRHVVQYPLVSYVFAMASASPIFQALQAQQLEPKIAFSATDADVIKTYVRLGFGVGILASMAYVEEEDTTLTRIDASHLFDWSVTYIGMRRGVLLRGYMYAFMQLFSPHLTRERVELAEQQLSQAAILALFDGIELPQR